MGEIPSQLVRQGHRWLASYATDPVNCRGRLHDEPESPTRSPFQRDRDRIIHSNAFRRLKHKTQVFIHYEGDHYRTRLTHSLEVAQIARSLARPLGLDEDLTEALALAHDLGHTPFGHAGEAALDDAMSQYGGFDHNAQSLRIVTKLEQRYPLFDGLNLTFETLEGLVKHNGPLLGREPDDGLISNLADVPFAIREYLDVHDLEAHLYPSLEAQVAAIADDIAYDSHDIEDGLRAGLIGLGDLHEIAMVDRLLSDISQSHPGLDRPLQIYELVRRLITILIEDVLVETHNRIEESSTTTYDDVRKSHRMLCGFSEEIAAAEGALKRFLFEKLYRNAAVMKPVRDARSVVANLFDAFSREPDHLPQRWRSGLDRDAPDQVARRVADYIAGMTDRYALIEHRRLFDATPELG